jgi:hypothetical protein
MEIWEWVMGNDGFPWGLRLRETENANHCPRVYRGIKER